jgi:hypothetical protein
MAESCKGILLPVINSFNNSNALISPKMALRLKDYSGIVYEIDRILAEGKEV